MKRHYVAPLCLTAALAGLFFCRTEPASSADPTAQDPGVRQSVQSQSVQSSTKPGDPLPGLTKGQLDFFNASKDEFSGAETVAEGLGPRMNLDSCQGCHAQPAVGGSSPMTNPQIAFATKNGMTNSIPAFISANGPVREARFKTNPDGSPDGGVHSLFTIAGSMQGCNLQQPDYDTAILANNVIFRIPTPVFGAGLIEQIPDSVLLANQAADAGTKQALGIRGRPNIVLAGSTVSGQPNHNGNDGTAARFGWKAQNKSLLLFAGEAYNVEMGITNELFQTERDETPECLSGSTPNDVGNPDGTSMATTASGIEKFAAFMRFLAPPAPSPTLPGGAFSIWKGRGLFMSTGCAQCHTPTLRTGNSTVVALSNKPVNLFSDLLIHDMGAGLADGISQGQAGPSEFRTAPLWGLGQRIFFLHDGRTSNLVDAIQQHFSFGTPSQAPSEANAVIGNYNRLSEQDKQHLLNFLRSL